MPSTSKKQHNFMEAVAHNPGFAKKVGIPQSVGQDFSNADKGRKFSKGGDTMATKMNPRIAAMMMARKPATATPMSAPPQGMKKGGMSMAAFEKSGKDVEKRGMKEGSKADMAMDKKQMMGMKKGGMASGGSASSRADGVATKGKTKGTFVKMNKGGMSC
jgi:hypothetical protein